MTEAFGIPGVVLAGGLARRMGGGDKPLREIGGRTILAHVIARLKPQCEGLLLSANGDPSRFASFGLPVIADGVNEYLGPLAGILAGLDWVAGHFPEIEWLASAPGDCPFLPADLVPRLHEARIAAAAPLACASSGGQRHHAAALWPVALRDDMRAALRDGTRRIEAWTARHGVAVADWPTAPVDPFFNVNTPEDVALAERLAQQVPG
jgi:molybdopterin-guanine dinucleotide biosynthesis protein A